MKGALCKLWFLHGCCGDRIDTRSTHSLPKMYVRRLTCTSKQSLELDKFEVLWLVCSVVGRSVTYRHVSQLEQVKSCLWLRFQRSCQIYRSSFFCRRLLENLSLCCSWRDRPLRNRIMFSPCKKKFWFYCFCFYRFHRHLAGATCRS